MASAFDKDIPEMPQQEPTQSPQQVPQEAPQQVPPQFQQATHQVPQQDEDIRPPPYTEKPQQEPTHFPQQVPQRAFHQWPLPFQQSTHQVPQQGEDIPPLPNTETSPQQAPQQASQHIPPQVVVIQGEQSGPPLIGTFTGRLAVTLGAIQTLLGVFAITMSFVGLGVDANLSPVAQGCWGGCMFIISGSVTIAAGKQKRYSLICASLGMSVFVAVVAVVGLGVHCVGASLDYQRETCGWFAGIWQCRRKTNKPGLAVNCVLAVLNGLEMLVAIWTSVLYCCSGHFCSACDKDSNTCCDCCDCCVPNREPSQRVVYTGNQVEPFVTINTSMNQQNVQQRVYPNGRPTHTQSNGVSTDQSRNLHAQAQRVVYNGNQVEPYVTINPPMNQQNVQQRVNPNGRPTHTQSNGAPTFQPTDLCAQAQEPCLQNKRNNNINNNNQSITYQDNAPSKEVD